jgi:hypothetical protein
MNRARDIVPSLAEINARLTENQRERADLEALRRLAFKLTEQGQAVDAELQREAKKRRASSQ